MKTKKDEVLSRREFFKKAAKAALPILGAVVLTNLPQIAQGAKSDVPMGCTGTCKNACRGCEYTCTGGCKNYACKGVAKN